jgi:serine/threonine protein kinase
MVHGKPFFYESSEIGVIFKIFQLYGTPNNDVWEGVEDFKFYSNNFPKFKASGFDEKCPKFDEAALDLFTKMIALNPADRISAKMALKHEFFSNMDM